MLRATCIIALYEVVIAHRLRISTLHLWIEHHALLLCQSDAGVLVIRVFRIESVAVHVSRTCLKWLTPLDARVANFLDREAHAHVLHRDISEHVDYCRLLSRYDIVIVCNLSILKGQVRIRAQTCPLLLHIDVALFATEIIL